MVVVVVGLILRSNLIDPASLSLNLKSSVMVKFEPVNKTFFSLSKKRLFMVRVGGKDMVGEVTATRCWASSCISAKVRARL